MEIDTTNITTLHNTIKLTGRRIIARRGILLGWERE